MHIEFSAHEVRVIGSLIEKQITTPDQYPLSLNALTNACNQKSNRDPVMSLDEPLVQATLDQLARKHWVLEKAGFGSRVPKYQHRFCNTEYGTLKFSAQELAIVCELLLRGPQTPGELRARASRMAAFADAEELERVLQGLLERADGPFVARLAREPGRREARYAHLFCGPVSASAAAQDSTRDSAVAGDDAMPGGAGALAPYLARLERLEHEVRELRAELERLRSASG
jgi:uncharacterized protein